MTDELKPCPFCGGPAEVRHVLRCGQDAWTACCDESVDPDCCGSTDPTYFKKSDAIAAWNRRATPPPASVVERDPRTNPQPGDVKEYADGSIWVWGKHPSIDDKQAFAQQCEDTAEWLTREQWAARQQERETKTPP